jgi:hypothetical protein
MVKQSPKPAPDSRFLRSKHGPSFNVGLAVLARLSSTRALPVETTAHLRGASVPAKYGPTTSAGRHDGTVTSITSVEIPVPITAPTFTTTTMTPLKHP